MSRSEKLRILAMWLLLAALLALMAINGCTAKRVTTPDGTVIESYGFLAGHQLQAGEYERTMLGAKVKIDGYGQDHEAAKVIGQAVLEAMKKLP